MLRFYKKYYTLENVFRRAFKVSALQGKKIKLEKIAVDWNQTILVAYN